ncbi:uridine phosphorylase 1 [Biomphalaria glabrata]|uniref:Uridine phosphorylase 1-like n=1 Tax=Biomphalaria glabrata TaxID=6526 RepID=A0A9W3BQF0_BIOGL|nr:uridine phosphorylase 1-like [Biomphalaria glabrata]XP_055901664.1 uridine phosphorylase 1-like [Biomphalaria glabrata]KAI8743462.1 uridine phosphorylase 1-like [Biomphalaria glabrata]
MSSGNSFHAVKTEEELSLYIPQEGLVQLRNPHINGMDEDVLYHIALSNKSNNLTEMFQDVKFVCFGGSPTRMHKFAEYLVEELQIKIPAGLKVTNIAHGSDRYVLYKVGPVISVSHGMGIPSLSIIFHEILKLIHHAGCSDVIFFRIGTSGGLGLEPGSVVITEESVDGLLRPYMELSTLGMILQHPSKLDQDVARDLVSLANSEEDGYVTIIGKTMCTLDFYEGQARLDGAFCDYNEADKMAYLSRVHKRGIRNIEMESLCFAAYCYRAGIRGAVVCVTLLDRLKGDQITTPHDIMEEWQSRPQKLVAAYIKRKLNI